MIALPADAEGNVVPYDTMTVGDVYDALAFIINRWGRDIPLATFDKNALRPISAIASVAPQGQTGASIMEVKPDLLLLIGPEIAMHVGTPSRFEDIEFQKQDPHTPPPIRALTEIRAELDRQVREQRGE